MHYIDLNCAVDGECKHQINGYHCLKSGTFKPAIRVPRENVAGDWVVALISADIKKCTNKCKNISDYKNTELNIIATIPYSNEILEPKLFFERVSSTGFSPVDSAEIGDRIRIVLSNPTSSEAMDATIVIGNVKKVVKLKKDGDRLVSKLLNITQTIK